MAEQGRPSRAWEPMKLIAVGSIPTTLHEMVTGDFVDGQGQKMKKP
jgi:hypothetical protein